MEYRKLTSDEIQSLKTQGCSSSDWEKISIKEPFNPEAIYGVHFFGEVKIGKMIFPETGDPYERPGLYHSIISNCILGDNSRVAHAGLLRDYEAGEGSVIERVNEISMTGESSFGNGEVLDALNEGGGRDLMIFDQLTSQIAFMSVLYQHDHELIASLKKIIAGYAESKRSSTGYIGKNAVIRNANIIRNVFVGDSALIDGASYLSEGSIISCPEDQAVVGEGVTARHFIIHQGSRVTSSAILEKVFIGQGVRIGKQLSAENSVFFANCEGFHGEAVSLFAGPYSVSHHKSSLLIAALTSFYNAGSGTNQSNHMYKLGPIHQGILERGSKTGSFAYLLWPCHVGAYSVVMGKHGSNFDTSDFPFSYITLENEKSFLTPAMNLITVGTRRDVEKWPSRDKRKSKDKLDLITFEWLNPLIVDKAIKASSILGDLYDKTPKEQDSISYKGVRIKRLLLKSCRRYYDMLAPVFFGEQVIKRLSEDKELKPAEGSIDQNETWIDVGGMVVPGSKMEHLISNIRNGKISTIGAMRETLKKLFLSYDDLAWNWTIALYSGSIGKKPTELDKDDFKKIIMDWKDNKTRLNNMILADAKKEFDPLSRIGFGIHGNSEIRDRDFESVRGTYENNKFVKEILAENQAIAEKAELLISSLS